MFPSYEIVRPGVTDERLDGEVIVISNLTGRYYSLSGVAADIWYFLDNNVTFDCMFDILVTYFEIENIDQAKLETTAFIDELVTKNLVRESSVSTIKTLNLPSDWPRSKWIKPNLLEFSDLQDLILVDPIHDTTEAGWPIHIERK